MSKPDFSFEITDNGNLKIAVHTEYGRDCLSDYVAKRNKDSVWSDICEHMGWIGNAQLFTVAPEWIGAMTDSPILTDHLDYPDDATEPVVPDDAKVWWYPNYMVDDPEERLLDHGEVIFMRAPK